MDFENDTANTYNELANSYDRCVGTCMHSICRYAVSALPHPLQPGSRVLDNACGTAILTRELLEQYPEVTVDATDISPGMIQSVRSLIQAKHWEGKVEAAVMDGTDLKFPDETFDASFTMFGIFFLGEKGAAQIHRTLKTGGMAVVTTWENMGGLPILHEVQKIAKPETKPFSPPLMDQWQGKEILVETLQKGGFGDVQVLQRQSLLTAENTEELMDILMEMFQTLTTHAWGKDGTIGMKEPLRQVLKTQKERFVVEEEGKVGIRMDAYVAIAVK